MNKMRFSINPATGTLTDEDTRKYFSVVGYAVLALIVIEKLAAFGLSYLVTRSAPQLFSYSVTSHILSNIAIYLCGVPALFLVLRRLPAVSPLKTNMGGARFWGGLCCAAAAMFVGNYLSQIIIAWFEVMSGTTQTNPVEEMTSGVSPIINLVFIAIIAPILEELVFRKLLCDRLLPLGEGYAIVISAAIFGLSHGNLFQFLYAFALGLVFALVYVKTGKLIYTMIYHAIINFFGGVFAPWVLSKLDTDKMVEALEQVAESNYLDMTALEPYMTPLALLGFYESLIIGGAVVGTVLLVKAKKKYSLDSGILPPPKEKRAANVLMSTGVALCLMAFTAVFILSLI